MKSLLVAALFVAASIAAVVELTPDNFDQVVDGSKAAFVEFYAPWCGHCKNLAPEYEIVGETFAKESSVIIAKVDADAHKDLGARFDVHGFPTLKWFPKGQTTPEEYEGGRTAEDIVNFINRKAGTNVRVRKAPSAVVEVDDNTFDKVVLDPTKHVLVEFYAPWCGHCKKLAPDYEKVAKAFVNEPDVVIAKIDADGNRVKGNKYGVTGFPTIKWFPKDNKEEPMAYELSRSVEAFVEFINDHAGTKRNPDGRLKEDAGRIEELDALAVKFVDASEEERSNILKQVQEHIDTLSGTAKDAAKNYIRVMNGIQKKGKEFLESEPARLERMLAGDVAADKVDEFTIRRNILRAFQN